MWRVLVERGRVVGRHRVARLMRHDGLCAKTVTKWRATTHSSHLFPVAANQLNRQFTVAAPNQVWAGDLTYIWTMEGWLYLTVLLDLYSRAVVGWAMGARLTGELTQQALQMALSFTRTQEQKRPGPRRSAARIALISEASSIPIRRCPYVIMYCGGNRSLFLERYVLSEP
jgi:transposase InsO family protein